MGRNGSSCDLYQYSMRVFRFFPLLFSFLMFMKLFFFCSSYLSSYCLYQNAVVLFLLCFSCLSLIWLCCFYVFDVFFVTQPISLVFFSLLSFFPLVWCVCSSMSAFMFCLLPLLPRLLYFLVWLCLLDVRPAVSAVVDFASRCRILTSLPNYLRIVPHEKSLYVSAPQS